MKLKFLTAAVMLLIASVAGAGVSEDVRTVVAHSAEADARTLLGTVSRIMKLKTPADFEEQFGRGRETDNISMNMYRNIEWEFPLASIDVPMKMNVAFNYGELDDWSAVIDFGDRVDVGRAYFTAICRGFERATGSRSLATRFELTRADPLVCAYYPLSGDFVEVAAIDDPERIKIFVSQSPYETAQRVGVKTASRDVDMFPWPDDRTEVKRVLAPNSRLLSLASEGGWRRVQDGDGEIGWIRSSDAEPYGVTDIDHAFAPAR